MKWHYLNKSKGEECCGTTRLVKLFPPIIYHSGESAVVLVHIDLHIVFSCEKKYEPHHNKTCLLKQTGLCSYRRWLKSGNFGFRKKMDGIICIAKTKELISCAVITQLICTFVFAYAKSRFSNNAAHIKGCCNFS